MDNNKDSKQRAHKPFWQKDTSADARESACAKILDDEIMKLSQTAENFNVALNLSAFACFQIVAAARARGVLVPSDGEIEARLRAAIPDYFARDRSGASATLSKAKKDGLASPRWPFKSDERNPRTRPERATATHDTQPNANDAVQATKASRIWDEAEPIHGSLVERYLMDERAIDTQSIPDAFLVNVRFHPNVQVDERGLTAPAMICRLTDSLTGEPANAIQCAFLNPDGTKAKHLGYNGRKSIGKYGQNGAVMFGSPGDHDDHVECESVEDALTVLSERIGATGMAVLSVGRLGKLETCAGVNRIIAGDAKSERDRAAAAEAAQKLADRTCRPVQLALPPDGFGDFNEAIKSSEPGRVNAAIDAAATVTPRLPGLQFGDQPFGYQALNYIVKGLFGQGELGAVYGPSTAGKTFFMLFLAWCVALGRPFLGRRVRGGPCSMSTSRAHGDFKLAWRRSAGS